MMYQSTIFTVLSLSFLSVLAAPTPKLHPLNKRSYTGHGTWFNDGLGACGQWNSDSDPIVALPVGMYGSGGYCGQWVSVTNTATGKTAHGMTRDECEGCGPQDLDMSIGLFQQIGDLNAGVLPISWDFMPTGWSP